MIRTPDYARKHFGPLLLRNLHQALAQVIGEQFPRIGGPRIRALCAEMILDVIGANLRPREHVRHGQVLWQAIAADESPRRYQRAADTRLVPVVLDLSTAEDIQGRLDGIDDSQRLRRKIVRLCEQAYRQGGLLSNSDLAELVTRSNSWVARILSTHETETGQLVPRRATLHDVGTGLTHKRIICWKRYAEGKPADLVAKETYHSLEAVDRYLGQFDRVRHCRREGLSPEKTAFTLNCSVALVNEYLAIDRELEDRS